MNAGRTARERVRAELTREIVEVARRHLAAEGAAGLSLRAVARELGMVSSAVYRYFPSRDDLLTVLITEGYTALAETAERADAGRDPADHLGRWLALCRAVRGWALARPQEYALLYGSPVPGYRAPEDTVAPAVRLTMVYGRIVADAHAAGAVAAPDALPPAPPALAGDAERIRAVMPGVPDDLAMRALTAWTGLFGWLGFELGGQLENGVVERAAAFEHATAVLGALVGLRPAG